MHITSFNNGNPVDELKPLASGISATSESNYRVAIRATLIGLGVNCTLGVVKLVGGVLGQSFALISDSVNSLGDSIASVFTIVALRYAQLPPDEEHPYGHTRAEAIAGLFIAVLILASACYVGWEAIVRIGDVHPLPPIWTLWIAAANIAIKESLYRYNKAIGKRTGSTAIVANAWDHRSDALCSLAVLIGLSVIIVGGVRWIWADEVAALIVAAAILWSGGRLLVGSISELLDPQADADFVQQVREFSSKVHGVRAVEKLWIRKTGIEYLIDIHIQVDADMTVAVGHRIGHLVRDQLIAEFAAVRDVLVHLEPFPQENNVSVNHLETTS